VALSEVPFNPDRVDEEVVARADHKWGEAPFHFVDSVYIDFVQRLRTWWKGYDRRLSL
jgi:hypothetical protein